MLQSDISIHIYDLFWSYSFLLLSVVPHPLSLVPSSLKIALLVPFCLCIFISFLMTQWGSFRLVAGTWVVVCLQEHGHLTSGYTTEENVPPSPSMASREEILTEGEGLMSFSLLHEILWMGSSLPRSCAGSHSWKGLECNSQVTSRTHDSASLPPSPSQFHSCGYIYFQKQRVSVTATHAGQLSFASSWGQDWEGQCENTTLTSKRVRDAILPNMGEHDWGTES